MLDKKEKILTLIQNQDRTIIKKNIQKALSKLNDPFKVSIQLNKIFEGNLSTLNENEVDEILNALSEDDVKPELNNLEEKESIDKILKLKQNEINELKDKLEYEKELRIKLEKLIKVTKMQQPIIIEDEDINDLYYKYLNEGIMEFRKAKIFKYNGCYIILKSFYTIGNS